MEVITCSRPRGVVARKTIGGAVLIARSSLECHLYIELHPCECGAKRAATQHRLESRDEALITVYEGRCRSCTRLWQLEFALDAEIPPGRKFGGTRASQLIDAGQFLAVADAAASAAPVDVGGLDDAARHRVQALLLRAVAALEEVVKFIPPGGDRVPAEALFSTAGKELYLAEPGRFRRSRLEAVLGVYRDGSISTLGRSGA